MDKRYQVFISSTYEDLQEERKEVMQALLELDCIPAGMELFPASNDDQWTLIKRVIDDCDYYLLIVGGRYGSTNKEGISYTQMEFEYALKGGKPIISFLPQKPDEIVSKKCESSEEGKKKLEEFKKLVKTKMVKYWSNPADLGSVVSRSVIKLIKDCPSVGWIKADNIIDENTTKDLIRLQRENEDLRKQLQNIATQPPKGTEAFAQGNDKVFISYSFEGEDKEGITYDCTSSIATTWNDIFSSIAPELINDCKEYYMRDYLNRLIKTFEKKILKSKAFSNIIKAKGFKIQNESYNLIKVQLKALGLIKISDRKRGIKDTNEYWTLTEYGDYLMTQLLAIKKEDITGGNKV